MLHLWGGRERERGSGHVTSGGGKRGLGCAIAPGRKGGGKRDGDGACCSFRERGTEGEKKIGACYSSGREGGREAWGGRERGVAFKDTKTD